MSVLLGDHEFSLSCAELTGSVYDPVLFADGSINYEAGFRWVLHLSAWQRQIGDAWFAPVFWIEPQIPSRDWRWLDRKILDLGGPLSAWPSWRWKPSDGFLVWDEVQILESQFFVRGANGATLDVEWSGQCVMRHPPFDRPTPFYTDEPFTFRGVSVAGSARDTVETLRHKLSQYLDADDLVPGELWRNPTACVFAPK